MATDLFDKEISMGMNHRFNQLPQEENSQFEVKEKKWGE
jgi:hypothetical protein